MINPQFKHDCENCKFVGNIFSRIYKKKIESDLYLNCDISEFASKYIIRLSDEGSDYITTSNLAEYI